MKLIKNKKSLQPLISAVVVCHNDKKWLKRCLGSIFTQDYQNFEVIVVDNASNDGSINLIKTFFPQVCLIPLTKNTGFIGGADKGVREARGEFILLLNSDIWLENNFFAKLLKIYKKNKCDLLAPLETEYSNPKFRLYTYLLDILGHTIKVWNKICENPICVCGCCMFFKKDLYLETGGFDKDFFMYFEEPDWCWRLILLNKKIFQANNLFIYHASLNSNRRLLRYSIFLLRNRNIPQMLLKNYAWYSLLWILPIYFFQNIIEILFFLIVSKPKIAATYLAGWWFNIKNFKRIIKKRAWIQRQRKVGDWQILKKMYFGSAKLLHLIDYYFPKKDIK